MLRSPLDDRRVLTSQSGTGFVGVEADNDIFEAVSLPRPKQKVDDERLDVLMSQREELPSALLEAGRVRSVVYHPPGEHAMTGLVHSPPANRSQQFVAAIAFNGGGHRSETLG